MPRYDYECSKCGVFEAWQPMTADKLEHCPICYGKVDRLISMPAIVEANTRLSTVKKCKDIINYVDKKNQHGTHPNMQQAMIDYSNVCKKGGISGGVATLDR